jgi:gliding motility-associated-like protein
LTKDVTINATPTAAIMVQNNCLSDTTRFYDNTTTYGIATTSWRWDFGDEQSTADTSILQNPVYLYTAYNTYTTELIVVNEAGCTDTTTAPVTIYKPPVAQFSYMETCQSYFTYFTDESIGDSALITNYNWHFGDPYSDDSTSTQKDPYHVYDTLGIYRVHLEVSDANSCSDTTSQQIEIYPIPTALFTLTDNWEERQGQVKLDNQSIGATSYFWDFDDTFTSEEESPVHQYEYDSDPLYNLMLVAWNNYGCPDTLIYPYELLFTGLYVPNAFSPSANDEQFKTFSPVGINLSEYKLEVFSSWGNLIFSTTQIENGRPAQGWDGTYEGKDMPTGTYIWRISARFSDDTYWRGSDNGDGHTNTNGTVTLIR